MLIDIGGGTTDVAVWKDGALVHSQIIPLGGSHFTNDLAVALKIPHNEAERIKLQHGLVLAEQADPNVHISIQGMSGTRPKEVAQAVVAEVLGARADELCAVVREIIKEKQLETLITGGYVLTGGGAMIRGIAELAEYNLEKAVKVGFPRPIGGMGTVMQEPKFATVLGLLLDSGTQDNLALMDREEDTEDVGPLMGKFGSSLRNIFKELF